MHLQLGLDSTNDVFPVSVDSARPSERDAYSAPSIRITAGKVLTRIIASRANDQLAM